MVLAASGGIKHEDLVQLAQKHLGSVSGSMNVKVTQPSRCRFTGIPNIYKFVPGINPNYLFWKGSEIRVRDDDMPFAHIAVAVEGCGWANPDNFPLMVANTIIGSWDRSQGGGANLASNLASYSAQSNLCHSFQSFNTCYKDTGLWGIYFVCEPMKCDVSH